MNNVTIEVDNAPEDGSVVGAVVDTAMVGDNTGISEGHDEDEDALGVFELLVVGCIVVVWCVGLLGDADG